MTALTDHAWQDCALSQWRGDSARCRWCDQVLRGTRILFCQSECKAQAVENHAWATAKKTAKERDHGCVRCRARKRLHVHHTTPCAGTRTFSCLHHLGGLETLCETCHEGEHGKARAA